MGDLTDAIINLVANTSPEKSVQLAAAIKKLASAEDVGTLPDWSSNPATLVRLRALFERWKTDDIPSSELAGMIAGASAAYHRAKSEQEVELVWTGPSSTLVATRKTEQALVEVIDNARSSLFITSFVAYDISAVMQAFARALQRGVGISMLLEASDVHGGSVSIDAIGKMKAAFPAARIFSWLDKSGDFYGGKVHAKIAVADETICFVSSANLTGHAMAKNMEAGILVRGGTLPKELHRHLEALRTTKVIVQV